MRLIDADALNKELQKRIGSPTDNVLYEVNLCIIVAPTIDAIPVEWLKGLMLSTEDDVDKVEFAWIMREWQKEQEGYHD